MRRSILLHLRVIKTATSLQSFGILYLGAVLEFIGLDVRQLLLRYPKTKVRTHNGYEVPEGDININPTKLSPQEMLFQKSRKIVNQIQELMISIQKICPSYLHFYWHMLLYNYYSIFTL